MLGFMTTLFPDSELLLVSSSSLRIVWNLFQRGQANITPKTVLLEVSPDSPLPVDVTTYNLGLRKDLPASPDGTNLKVINIFDDL